MPNAKLHPHEIAGHVPSFQMSNGHVISRCLYPDCQYGIGHEEQGPRPSGLPLYTKTHKLLSQINVNLAVDPEEREREFTRPELTVATDIRDIFKTEQPIAFRDSDGNFQVPEEPIEEISELIDGEEVVEEETPTAVDWSTDY